MYTKEINLEDAIKVASNQNSNGIYYFLGEDDEYPDGVIDGYNNLAEELDFEKSIAESENANLELAKIVLDDGGQLFCLFGYIWDNSEIGEDGFFVEGIFENYNIDVSYEDTNFTDGGFGFYIKKIDDKYMCDKGIYFLQPTGPHGPANEFFKHFSDEFNDEIGEVVLKELEDYL